MAVDSLTTTHFALLATLIPSLALVLWAEVKSNRPAQWIFKPLASTCFVGLAIVSGALESTFGLWILAGLVFSWFGDVLLIPAQRAAFVAGLGSFLAGHVAYGVAFLVLGVTVTPTLGTALPLSGAAWLILRWLWPHLPDRMRGPVIAYVVTILAMVALSVGAARLELIAAAILFAISDLFVARQRFIETASINRLTGLPLYYLAQVIFALNCAQY